MWVAVVLFTLECSDINCPSFHIGQSERSLYGDSFENVIAIHTCNFHVNSSQLTSLCHDSVYQLSKIILKEALHIRLTNKDERFNRDVGMVVPDCWVATINHPPSTHVRMPAHAH